MAATRQQCRVPEQREQACARPLSVFISLSRAESLYLVKCRVATADFRGPRAPAMASLPNSYTRHPCSNYPVRWSRAVLYQNIAAQRSELEKRLAECAVGVARTHAPARRVAWLPPRMARSIMYRYPTAVCLVTKLPVQDVSRQRRQLKRLTGQR